jgi:hypothetical protein
MTIDILLAPQITTNTSELQSILDKQANYSQTLINDLFHTSISCNNIEFVKYLILIGASISFDCKKLTVQNNNLEILKILFDNSSSYSEDYEDILKYMLDSNYFYLDFIIYLLSNISDHKHITPIFLSLFVKSVDDPNLKKIICYMKDWIVNQMQNE